MPTLLLSVLLTVILPPPDYADIPSGLNATVRWQYGCQAASETLAALEYPGWHNWIADDCGEPNHTPMVYSMAGDIAAADANEFWLIGNEPNIASTAIAPADAAAWAQQWAAQNDATWACCGTLHNGQYPSLLTWLDAYLDAGGPIPDAWHVHIYFVANDAQWQATLRQMEDWMADNDVVRPLIVSETAQTLHDRDATPLLEAVARDVCNERIAAAYWYPGDKDAYDFAPRSQLTINGEITALGERFVALQDCPEPEPTPTPKPTPSQPIVWRVYVPITFNGG